MVWDRQCLKYSEQKDHSNNESMNHEGVYRTTWAATPSLLNNVSIFIHRLCSTHAEHMKVTLCGSLDERIRERGSQSHQPRS